LFLSATNQLFLRELEARLARFRDVDRARSANSLSVAASGPDGFAIAMIVGDGGFTLRFDGWQETLHDTAQARALFQAALSGEARLRVDTLAGRRWRWTLELLRSDGRWAPESTLGHPTWRLYGRSGVVYLRNSFALGSPA